MTDATRDTINAGVAALVEAIAERTALLVLSRLAPGTPLGGATVTDLADHRPAPVAATARPAAAASTRPAAAPAPAATGNGKPAPWREGDPMITTQQAEKMRLKEEGGIFQRKGMDVLRAVVNEIEVGVQFSQLSKDEAAWAIDETYARLNPGGQRFNGATGNSGTYGRR
ncbi:MAG: hypothetical protein NVS2B17_31080 [Candidatus Velthaea sp.]